MFKFIIENREWIFSGVGIAAIAVFWSAIQWIWKLRENPKHRRALWKSLSVTVVALFCLHFLLYIDFWKSAVQTQAYHFVLLPVVTLVLTAVLSYFLIGFRLRQLTSQFESLTASDNFQDELTKIPNVKALEHIFVEKLNQAKDNSDPLSVLLIDVDNFKAVNDRFSMTAGDSVIGELANLLSADLRTSDAVVRYKMGDEFLLISYRATGENAANRLGGRLLKAISTHSFTIPETESHASDSIALTVSIGVTEIKMETDDLNTTSERVEKALKRAKKKKNTVELI